MKSSRPGLVISPIWFDDHMIELHVAARNKEFAGAADVYADHGTLAGAAMRLAGFPSSPTDRREILWGTKSSSPWMGFVKLSFFCSDHVGHPFVRVELQSTKDLDPECVTMLIPIEAAAVDRFVTALRRADEKGSDEVVLEASIDRMA